jgi:hypothetical protein
MNVTTKLDYYALGNVGTANVNYQIYNNATRDRAANLIERNLFSLNTVNPITQRYDSTLDNANMPKNNYTDPLYAYKTSERMNLQPSELNVATYRRERNRLFAQNTHRKDNEFIPKRITKKITVQKKTDFNPRDFYIDKYK